MKLSKALQAAIQAYYYGRHRQRAFKESWDKEAALDAVQRASSEQGYTMLAMAGTFWFSRPYYSKKQTMRISESSFPGYDELVVTERKRQCR